MKQQNCKIIENTKIAQKFYKIRAESPYLAKTAKPGQFIEVKCSDEVEPFLRRPFSIHRITKNGIEILYEVVGKSTELLTKKKAGGSLDVIGPLGHGFEYKSIVHGPWSIVLVAGGIGVAPLVALAESVLSCQLSVPSKRKKIYALIGAKTKTHVLCEEEFKKYGAEVFVSTEDGSKGHKGFITDLLRNKLATGNWQLGTVCACGPYGMLKAVAKIAEENDIDCQVSLEERMACGVGVCLGCPVKVYTDNRVQRTEYRMVCKDGPVFNAEEIAW